MSDHHSSSKTVAFQSIPVVDVSGLNASDLEQRQAVAAQLAQAASDVGFIYVCGHGIDQSLIDALIQSAKDYFAQPLDAKMVNYIGLSHNHSGYVPEGEEQFYGGTIDHKESYDIGFELHDPSRARPMLGRNQWPDFPQFQGNVSAYYQAALACSRVLFRGFALALGLDEHVFDAKTLCPPSQLRMVHYPFNPDAHDRQGIGAHTDYECFTLLLPTADGLEVLNGAGEWIDAPVKPGCLVVNIGDMLEILSNGRFIATSHRVRKVKQERYSFPLFCSCDYDTRIEPVLPPLPGADPKHYQALVCGDHLYAQTMHTFQYLKARLARGEISLPQEAQALAHFGKVRSAVKP